MGLDDNYGVPVCYYCRLGRHDKCPIVDARNVKCACGKCHPQESVDAIKAQKAKPEIKRCPNCGFPIDAPVAPVVSS